MEALVEAALHSDALSLEITNTQTPQHEDQRGLRHVTEKLLPSRHYATGLLSTDGSTDCFTGWIDAVTGVPVWGVRHYQLTGEWYDGSFDEQGLRLQGTVHNVFLPPPVPAIPDLLGKFRKEPPAEEHSSGVFQLLYGARYRKGILEFGTLVTNRVLYRGTFVHQRFHGSQCEWISLVVDTSDDDDSTTTVTTTTTTTYIGDFQQGFFHGNGTWQQSVLTTAEDDDFEEEQIHSYTGHFRNGMKHGQGRYTIRKLKRKKDKDEIKKDATTTEDVDDETAPSNITSTSSDYTGEGNQKEEKKWIQFIIHDAESNFSSTRSTIPSETMLKQLEHIFPLTENMLTNNFLSEQANQNDTYSYIYKGSFYGNARQGEGLEQCENGDVYQGQYKNNERHGHGCLQQTTKGNVYYGKWYQGEPSQTRYWTINTVDEELYLGQVLQWKPHGYGVLYTKDAVMTQVGIFSHGILQNGLTAHITKGVEFTFQPATTTNNLELLETLGEIAEALRVKNHDFPLRSDYHATKAAADPAISSSEEDENSKDNQFTRGKKVFARKILAQAVTSTIGTSLQMIAANAEQATDGAYEYIDDEEVSSDSEEEEGNSDDENNDSYSMNKNRRVSLNMNEVFTNKQRTHKKAAASLTTNFSLVSLNSNMMNSFSTDGNSSILSLNHSPEFTPEDGDSPSSPNKNNNDSNRIQLHSYANGDMYLGRLRQQRHRVGVGVHVSRNGSSYVGTHEHHKRHGYGVLRKSDGKQQYAGGFNGGKKHGPVGTLINHEQYYYHGGFNQDVLEGKKGILVHNFSKKEEKYDIYIGEWKAGQYHGYGIHITNIDDEDDGGVMNRGIVEIYQGYFRHGLRNGKGTLITKDISSNQSFEINYCGQWQNDDYHGFGTERISSDRYYEGQFHNGEKHGYGVMKHLKSGDCYQGYWDQDHPSGGKWRIQYSIGNLYNGQAQVIMTPSYDEDELIIPLKLQGFGTMQYYNGDVYVGEFQNAQRHGLGYGITTIQSWEGTWQDDVETEKDGILTLKSDGSIHYKGRNMGVLSAFCRLGRLGQTPARLQYWEQDHIMNLIMS